MLRKTILSSLEQAETLRITSIAFPAISTGVFGFPKQKWALTFFRAIDMYFDSESENKLGKIRLVNNEEETAEIFATMFDSWIEFRKKCESSSIDLNPVDN